MCQEHNVEDQQEIKVFITCVHCPVTIKQQLPSNKYFESVSDEQIVGFRFRFAGGRPDIIEQLTCANNNNSILLSSLTTQKF